MLIVQCTLEEQSYLQWKNWPKQKNRISCVELSVKCWYAIQKTNIHNYINVENEKETTQVNIN
jgi:hypothetical protein